ncbi:MAG: TorF family putative porin, partial [Gammaproteobacteria bacterium]
MNRAIQLRLAGLGAVALAAASGAAQAEISSTLTIASDYDFRGITQTALDPAFQASLDWAGESGL